MELHATHVLSRVACTLSARCTGPTLLCFASLPPQLYTPAWRAPTRTAKEAADVSYWG